MNWRLLPSSLRQHNLPNHHQLVCPVVHRPRLSPNRRRLPKIAAARMSSTRMRKKTLHGPRPDPPPTSNNSATLRRALGVPILTRLSPIILSMGSRLAQETLSTHPSVLRHSLDVSVNQRLVSHSLVANLTAQLQLVDLPAQPEPIPSQTNFEIAALRLSRFLPAIKIHKTMSMCSQAWAPFSATLGTASTASLT